MKTLTEQIARKCVHFNGISEKCCEAGIAYASVRDEASSPYRFPCFRDSGLTNCEKQQFPTDEAVAAEVAAIEESSIRTLKALRAASDDARLHDYRKGNGGQGDIKCPCCESGRLRYSVAHTNGHLWGKCSTPECVSWMQ